MWSCSLLLVLVSASAFRLSDASGEPVCDGGRVDVFAVVDGSGSVGATNFGKVKATLIQLANDLNLSPDGVRLGVITFNNYVAHEMNLTSDINTAEAEINALSWPNGGTNTYRALDRLLQLFQSTARPGVKTVGLVLTDGISSDTTRTVNAATALKDYGTTMYAVGINRYDLTELQGISSESSTVVELENFDQLAGTIGIFPHKICGACADRQLDVFAVVDGSGSVGPTNFPKLKSSLVQLARILNLSPYRVRLGVITYSNYIAQEMNLTSDINTALTFINALTFPNGGTNTYRALERLLQLFQSTARPGVKTVGLVLTDGISSNTTRTVNAATALKDYGTTMYAVGINRYDLTELEAISSESSTVVELANFDQLTVTIDSFPNKMCEVCIGGRLDVFAVVDGSGSVKAGNFEKVKASLIQLAHTLNLSPDGVRLGVITYSNYVAQEIHLTSDINTAVAAINALSWPNGGTNTYRALDRLLELFESTARPGVKTVGLVLTDGISSDTPRTVASATALKDYGTTMYAVGVNRYDLPELEAISSDASTVVGLENFDQLAGKIDTSAHAICEVSSVCYNRRLEVFVVVDGSGSVTSANFEKVKASLVDLADTLKVAPGGLRLGVITYSNYIAQEMNLTSDINTAVAFINALNFPNGGTNTYRALDRLLELFESTARPGVKTVGLVLTDGISSDTPRTVASATALKDYGTTMYAVGVHRYDLPELQEISSDASTVVKLENFDQLAGTIESSAQSVCDVDDGWSDWSTVSTSACSVTCGTGSMDVVESRTCRTGGPGCTGSTTRHVTQTCEIPCITCDNCVLVNGVWYIAHPTDCRVYLECTENINQLRSCGEGQVWSQDDLECVQEVNSNCVTSIRINAPPPPCQYEAVVGYPDQFLEHTANSGTVTRYCASGEEFVGGENCGCVPAQPA